MKRLYLIVLIATLFIGLSIAPSISAYITPNDDSGDKYDKYMSSSGMKDCKKKCSNEYRECKRESEKEYKTCKKKCKYKYKRGYKRNRCWSKCRKDRKSMRKECKKDKRVCIKKCENQLYLCRLPDGSAFWTTSDQYCECRKKGNPEWLCNLWSFIWQPRGPDPLPPYVDIFW